METLLHQGNRRAQKPRCVFVATKRLERILNALATDGTDKVSARGLCERINTILEVGGTGVMLMTGDVAYGSLCATNEVSELIEELQYSLGEGPCIDAYGQDQVIAEPDLACPKTSRWAASGRCLPSRSGTALFALARSTCTRTGPGI
jgi:hypothetical protein